MNFKIRLALQHQFQQQNTVDAAQRMVRNRDVSAVFRKSFEIFFGNVKIDLELVKNRIEEFHIGKMFVAVVDFIEGLKSSAHFINSQPEKVPNIPYFSALIAFATSLAVTKPM